VLNVFHNFSAGATDFNYGGTGYQIEVRHQTSADSLSIGVALEAGPDAPRHYLGAAAVAGSGWRRGAWLVEGDVGLGVEVLDGRVKTVTVTNNSSQLAPATETTVSFEPVPGLFARVGGGAGLRLARDFDLVTRLGVHLSSSGQVGSFLSSTVGVRLRLP
jgi:hypothetical protein